MISPSSICGCPSLSHLSRLLHDSSHLPPPSAPRPIAGPSQLKLPTREQLGLSDEARRRRDAVVRRFKDLVSQGVKLAATDVRVVFHSPPMSMGELKRHGRGKFAPNRQRDARTQASGDSKEGGAQTEEVDTRRVQCQVRRGGWEEVDARRAQCLVRRGGWEEVGQVRRGAVSCRIEISSRVLPAG